MEQNKTLYSRVEENDLISELRDKIISQGGIQVIKIYQNKRI